jgi:hypothetical protein
MATEAQAEIEMQLDLLEQMMADDQTDWDLYADNELDESGPLPSEEERQELEQDLREIALEISLKKHTFVRLTPKLFQRNIVEPSVLTKTNSKCSQPRSFIR